MLSLSFSSVYSSLCIVVIIVVVVFFGKKLSTFVPLCLDLAR